MLITELIYSLAGVGLFALGVRGALLLMSAVVALETGIYASDHFHAKAPQGRFWPLWMLLLAALNGLFLSRDLFPLHFWLPPAHADAPAPVSATPSAVVRIGPYP